MSFRPIRLPLLALASASLVSGCASIPNIAPGPVVLPVSQPQSAKTLQAQATDWPADEWWRRYGDPQLDTLVAEAIASSPTLEIATARYHRAEAVVGGAKASNLPQLSLGASFAEAKASYWNGVPYAGVPKGVNDAASLRLSMDWQLDFFGRNRAAIAAAISAREAARADEAQARLLLTTSVVDAYVDYLGYVREAALADDAVRVRERTSELVGKRRDRGLETLASAAQAVSGLATAHQLANAAAEAVNLTKLRIAALVGAGPDRSLDLILPQTPNLRTFGLPANIPADLVGKRPDLRSARFRLEARASQVKQARAGFYPSVNLSAFIGPQVLGLSQFFNSESLAGNVGPAISLPIFRGGALSANLRGARADYDEAVASYNETLLHALQDVAQVATSQRALEEQLAFATSAQSSAEVAYRAANERYRGGLLNYINVLSAENTLIAARRAVSQLETRRFMLDVALVRALGGGVSQLEYGTDD
ncbi:putative outer membrane efflux protein [Novosphingobium resinovorum]|uniref:Putative outer membrane efflux protein n=1 Tax=Novosphingobium resinovorum TaxID=158500 RepID=A0A031JFL9_9SPHN|nr:efflux transporter outer membrane subunit [Novosphingobium resinovorum]EZP71515.1 putative outer membrane efflux protein [Novosphingobium resinovorum]